jgi:hypothetical protein
MTKAPSYWLKTIGAADWPLADRWPEERPELLKGVRAPSQPTGISSGDRLIYYSAVSQKIFAIARATQDGENVPIAPGPSEARWPYLLPVQVLLAIPTLTLAPSWNALGIPGATMRQHSYVAISDAAYALGWEAIVARTRPEE